MQVNYTDIPSIDDIDGDGDLDVLVYNFALGKSIRYHKNMSMEKFGNPDSLDFELVDQEWGQFQECECNMFAFTTLGESCDILYSTLRTKHIGGKSLLLVDMNGDGVQDLILGHDLCDELYYFPNTGTTEQALMTSYSVDFPDSVNPANFPVFPAGYYDDFNNDGIKDLVVSPNDETNVLKNIDYANSVWFYKNTGKNNLPSFHLESKNFLQGSMIDVGENAKPLLIDVDGDGDLDLLVAGNGHEENGTYYGYVTFYENSGSAAFPEFRLTDKDFLGLSAWHLFDMYIGSADFNGDGSIDLFVSGTNPADESIVSKIIYNTATRNSLPLFDADHPEAADVPLEVGDTPCFTDVDKDGHVDLLIGKYTGRLDYYRNLSDGGSPVFVLKENDYLGISDSFFEFRKFLVPWVADIDLDGNDDLVTSDYLGDLFVYWNFRNGVTKQQLKYYNPLLDQDEIREQGDQTWITSGRIFKDKYPVILLGNKQGGLTLFRQELPGNSDNDNKLVVSVYPNPVNNNQAVNFKANQSGQAVVFNGLGQPVSPVFQITANRAKPFDITGIPQGLYIIKITDIEGRVASTRFIVHR